MAPKIINKAFELAYEPGPRRKEYSILLIVVDDLRADRLSCYGAERETAPNLNRRATSATRFTNCHSPVGWTLPGCASLITGQLPDEHGLVDHNRKFLKAKLGHYLGERYHRAGITNNGNVVTDSISPETLESLGFKRRPAKWQSFGWDAGFDDYQWTPREDHETPFRHAREFLEKREERAAKPWFLFFHTNVVHDYHMDRELYLAARDWLGEEVHPGLCNVHDGPDIWRNPPPGTDQKLVRRHLLAKYDAAIRYVDSRVEEMLSLVDFDNTIVIFASDHGEGFDPQLGRVHHCGRLHADLTHVPLLIWLPPALQPRIEPASVEQRFCSTVDIVPTALTLLGDAVSGFPGHFLYDLPTHRRLEGCDRGYVYWNEDCRRESYDTCRIDIRSELTYPLKEIDVRKNDALKEYAYNLAYDPGEQVNLRAVPAALPKGFEPISFVVAVNDEDELRHNLLSSPVAASQHHEWLLMDNGGNKNYDSVSALYDAAWKQARHDLVFFVHQDVFLPHGWEDRVFAALSDLEADDARWGVIGAVGALPPVSGRPKELRGHWCDPSGYHRDGPLPQAVQSLDEQWLGVRKSRAVRFDPQLPGFHCYGIDLSLTAAEAGLRTYALDVFVWHKYRDPQGNLVGHRDQSDKIRERWSDDFMAEFQPSADYVENKWKRYLPFQTTSWSWGNA